MILGRYLIISLVLDIKFSDNVINGSIGPYEGCLLSIVDIGNYNFKSITDKIVKPEESFINSYVNECLESNSAISSTQIMHIIIDAKHTKSDLNKVMTNQCQYLSTEEHYILITLLHRFKYLFDGMLGV